MSYTKYNWIGNQIDPKDMTELYERKQRLRIPITQQVAEAIKEYNLNNKK